MKILGRILLFTFLFYTASFRCYETTAAPNAADLELFVVAQKAFNDGFYDISLSYLQQLLQEYPDTSKTIPAKLLLGQCFFFKGQYLKAYAYFEELIKYSDFKDASLFWLAETCFKGKDYSQAQKYYRQVMELYPYSSYAPQAYYALGWTFAEESRDKEAIVIFQEFLQRFPAHELAEDVFFKIAESAYHAADYDKARESFHTYLTNFPQSIRHDQAYFYLGESYYYGLEYASAIEYYQKAIAISNNATILLSAHISLGWCFLKIKDYVQSQQHFETALASAQKDNKPRDDILLGRASLFAEMQSWPDAVEAYTQIIDQYPQSAHLAQARLGRGQAFYNLGDSPKAIADFTAVIAESQTSSDIKAKALSALAWTHLKQKNAEEAIKLFEESAALTKNAAAKSQIFLQIADIYQDMGKYEAALATYDKILKNHPESLNADYIQYRQSIASLALEKAEAAILLLQNFPTRFPKSQYLQDSYYYLGLAYFKQNNWQACQETLERFLAAAAADNHLRPEAFYLIARSYYNMADYEKALKIFKKLSQDFPGTLSIVQDSEFQAAKCLHKKEEPAEALKRLKLILYKYPKSQAALQALLWLGQYYAENLNFENSLMYYQQILTDYPESDQVPTARFGVGQAYQAQNELTEALNTYKLIDESDRELYTKAKLAIGDIFSKQLDPLQAAKEYQDIIEHAPEFARDAYMKMAANYENAQNHTEAISAYRKALRTDQGLSEIHNAEIQFAIAELYETTGKFHDAIEAYLRIPYLYLDDPQWSIKAYLRIGKIFENQEDWGNAKLVYQKVLGYNTAEVKFAQERIDWIEKQKDHPKQ